MNNKEVVESLKIIADYCLSKPRCEGCIFKPIDYRVIHNECYFRTCPPTDAYAEFLKEKGRK